MLREEQHLLVRQFLLRFIEFQLTGGHQEQTVLIFRFLAKLFLTCLVSSPPSPSPG